MFYGVFWESAHSNGISYAMFRYLRWVSVLDVTRRRVGGDFRADTSLQFVAIIAPTLWSMIPGRMMKLFFSHVSVGKVTPLMILFNAGAFFGRFSP